MYLIRNNIFRKFQKALSENSWCLWNGKTPQRIIYGFYVSLLALDIKEYTILNFAYMLQYALNGSKFRNERRFSAKIRKFNCYINSYFRQFLADNANDISFAKQSLRNKAYEKLVAAKAAISDASPAYWECDPRIHEEGETYEQFKELLQVRHLWSSFFK